MKLRMFEWNNYSQEQVLDLSENMFPNSSSDSLNSFSFTNNEDYNAFADNNQNGEINNEPKFTIEQGPNYELGEKSSNYLNRKTNRPQENIFNEVNQTTESITDKNSKEREDNKIIKLKTYLINGHHNTLNDLLKEKGKKLCKLDTKIKEKIEKTYNLDIKEKPFTEIYYSNEISKRYRKEIHKTNNSETINYIYNTEEDDTIKKLKKLLGLTYNDIYKIFIEEKDDDEYENLYKNFNNIEDFKEYVKKKTKKGEKYAKNYVYGGNNRKGVKDLDLEQWFKDKKSRNRGKKNENKNNK